MCRRVCVCVLETPSFEPRQSVLTVRQASTSERAVGGASSRYRNGPAVEKQADMDREDSGNCMEK